MELLKNLGLLLNELNFIIAQYDADEWESAPYTSFELQDSPYGITHYNNNIYICIPLKHIISEKNVNGLKYLNSSTWTCPSAIEIDDKKSLIYMVDNTRVNILNLKFETITQWNLPAESAITLFRGIKIHGEQLFLTIGGIHQIFICDSKDGKLASVWGPVNGGSKGGEFFDPMGITLNNKNLYVCDQYNYRIQILTKENGNFVTQWGEKGLEPLQFDLPYSIYYCVLSETIYVGDNHSVQIYTRNGICRQRLGGSKECELNWVYGMCVFNDQLYVCDRNHHRVQVFRLK